MDYIVPPWFPLLRRERGEVGTQRSKHSIGYIKGFYPSIIIVFLCTCTLSSVANRRLTCILSEVHVHILLHVVVIHLTAVNCLFIKILTFKEVGLYDCCSCWLECVVTVQAVVK